MDGFKTSCYITLSEQPVRCCVAGQRECQRCELHEYIKGALPRTRYTVMLTNKFRPCSFIIALNGYHGDMEIMDQIDRLASEHASIWYKVNSKSSSKCLLT